MKDENYNVSDIFKMEEMDHIRQNQGMWIGASETPTRLLEEVLDNSLDEVQAGHCNIIGIIIDSKEKTFKVLDSGRGIPFDQKNPLDKDPPILICTSLFTSGKFKKNEQKSAYKIASGLHGVGLSAVTALSDYIELDIYRDGFHAYYKIEHSGKITRNQEKFSGDKPYSTRITVRPSEQYFNSLEINLVTIEERLRIACANYSNLKIAFIVDGKKKIIKGTEDELILDYLGKGIKKWFSFETKKGPEKCILRFAWDENSPLTPKTLTTVNLVRVHDGAHITKIYNIIKPMFTAFAKKHNYDFQPDDCLNWFRLYINLSIIKTSFEAQVKVKLEKKSDLTVMDPLEKQIEKYFKENETELLYLMERFQDYRKSFESKKALNSKSTKKRSSTVFTKLFDCSEPNGELLIGEGDSAVGGIIKVRNPKKHAILPLRGVIINSLKNNIAEILKNEEVKDIINAIGCGISKECVIEKLRYNKIILAADADPAGNFITVLLIGLFAHLTPDIIKNGRLYVCKTPLYGTRRKGKFVPLWTDEDVEKCRKNNETITRFKGLGEFNPADLKTFTLDDSTRKLIKVEWSKNPEKIFELLTSSTEKRNLIMNEWSL